MKKITLLFTILSLIFCLESNAQFPESFETSVPPTGWITVSNDADPAQEWTQSTAKSNTGANSAFIRYSSTAGEDWLITPQFTPTSSLNLLEFYQAQDYTSDYGSSYDVMISTGATQATLADFTLLDSQDEGDMPFALAARFVDLSSYVGTPIFIAFKFTNSFGDNWYVDDVNLISSSAPPECATIPVPADDATDVVFNIDGSLTMSWTPSAVGDAATGYTFSVGASANDLTLFTTTTSDTSIDINGFQFSTEYFWSIVPTNSGGAATGPCAVWSFTIEDAPPPPSNDNCGNPIAITINADETCTVVTAGTTLYATTSSQADDVSGTPNNDVWFSFVATSTSHNISLENRTNVGGGTSTSTDMGMGLYELTSDCDNLVFSSTSDPESYTATGLTVGSTYLLRVYGWFSSIQNVTFDVCVQTPPPPPPVPANDACSSATVVDTLPFTSSANASAATNNDGFVACGGESMNDGVWYTFTPTASGNLDISVDVTGWDSEIAVYTGSCGVFTCVDNADNAVAGGTESLSISVTAGTQYWLNIGQWSSSTDNSEGAYTFNATSSDGVSLGLDDIEISQFTYYPNPVNNILTLDAQKSIESVVAYNMLGQEVLRLSPNVANTEVDMSSLVSGAYFVKVSIQGATKTVRIIKQ